jgi:hypothetical protein
MFGYSKNNLMTKSKVCSFKLQAPQSMKAVLLSLFMLSMAFGNLLDIVVMVSVSNYINDQVKGKLFKETVSTVEADPFNSMITITK